MTKCKKTLFAKGTRHLLSLCKSSIRKSTSYLIKSNGNRHSNSLAINLREFINSESKNEKHELNCSLIINM